MSALRLPGARWDAARAAYLAPGCRYRELIQSLRAQGVACDDRVRRPAPAPLMVRDLALPPALIAAFTAWTLAGRRGTVVLPQRRDRLLIALAALAALQAPTLILVPQQAGLARWAAAIRQIYSGPLMVGGEGDGLQPITVAPYAAAGRLLGRWGNHFPLVVVDEAERWASGPGIAALELSTAEARLGVAALPTGGSKARERLAARVGPVVSRCLDRAAGGAAGACSRIQLYLELTADERSAYQQAQAGRACAEAQRLAGSAGAKLERIGRLLGQHSQQRLIIVAVEDGAARAVSRRYLLPALTGALHRGQRELLLRWLAANRRSYIVSAEVLEPGLALPAAEVGVLLGSFPSRCVELVSQQLRGPAGRPRPIYELFARATFEEDAMLSRGSGPPSLRAGDLRCLQLWA